MSRTKQNNPFAPADFMVNITSYSAESTEAFPFPLLFPIPLHFSV